METSKIWDKIANEYANQYYAITDWRLGYKVVEELLDEICGKKILDYGCGSGKFSRRLRDLGGIITAVDASQNAITEAIKNYDKGISYKFIENDNLSFIEGQSIDHAIATFVFCTIEKESQLLNIVNQIYQKLKVNGELIILDPHPSSPGYNYISMKREKPKEIRTGIPIKVELTGMKNIFYDYWRSIEDYKRILKKANFAIEAIKEPIIDNTKESFWKDERIQAPLIIIKAKKFRS